jgi:sodium/potassium/calcium exchanger 2
VALFLGILYMFLALAIVCDEFFVPALEEIASPRHMNISMDVAGATLMAAGGSAPELFTSFVGTFQQSDIGIGTIVGSAVFNVLFVIGVCSMLSKEVLNLTWWPLFRDCVYYASGLAVLSVVVGVSSPGEVTWWEALILFGMYAGYVLVMKYNRKLYKRLTGKELVLGSDTKEAVAAASSENAEENFHPTALESGEVADEIRPDANRMLSHEIERAIVHTDFRWPGTFRAGVLKLLLRPSSWEDKGGVGIVSKIQGDVEHVFKTVDLNGDGTIDLEELGKLFVKLGHEISHEDLTGVFASLDLDSNGMVSSYLSC